MKKTTLLLGIAAGIAIVLLAGLGSGAGTASADGGPHIATGSNATPTSALAATVSHWASEYLLKEAGTVEEFCYPVTATADWVQAGSRKDVLRGDGPGQLGEARVSTLGLRAGGFEEGINTTDPNNAIRRRPAGTL
jgi:hypothetical protein